ncbi:undecaprenyl-phosphate alpha-N-acetylglucosaminyl 1-phosphatetransferase [Oleiphilus messinensis]|uniref:Undecaprenyl-phosphate alpha-N-acetylglucosaminyl 1-phosphatetransferase n=1 Tax=Oleiphilus messinensis TaxID=141451 RepID=A0A1Y0IGS4_9GAMM|nr:MraY family glycosyltransferase [Oleiphilus messinensis]ARU59500.1 undecaprenyl-phosphate alpha-N-acetylglucosaminyl 1-phosphatetransferase [Oleiphilus messinensis]
MSGVLHLIPSFLATITAIYLLTPIARAVGLVDLPGGRKQHDFPTPLVGGLSIYLGSMTMAIVSPPIFEMYSNIFFIGGIVLVTGLLDDWKNLKVITRLSVYSLSGLVMIWSTDTAITSFGDILTFGDLSLGLIAIPVTLLSINCAINAVNMSDGLDGLAAGLVLVTLSALIFIGYSKGNEYEIRLLFFICVSVTAFFVLNFRFPWVTQASVFLGDSGSVFLGFIISWALITLSQGELAVISPPVSLWLFAVPLLDITNVVVKRLISGTSPTQSDRRHLHHILLRAGFGVRATVLILILLATFYAVIGILFTFYNTPDSIIFWIFIALGATTLHAVNLLEKRCSESSHI